MQYIMLIIVIIAWVYTLYITEKAKPSNGCVLAWLIWTIWWGVMVIALLSV